MKDIVLFFYYSSPYTADGCFLGLLKNIAYRNIFLVPRGDKIHFELPVFEDHSYNTICNRVGLRNLIQRPGNNEKYIIFRTGERDIIGFYQVNRSYYQETRMFNNYGFVWGIEGIPYLIGKGLVKYEGPRLRQGSQASWHSSEWMSRLIKFINKIQDEENISDIYKAETNRLIGLLKNPRKMAQWQRSCLKCSNRIYCILFKQFTKYNKENVNSNMFSVLNKVYNSNLYSRNILAQIPKTYLK